MTASSYGTVHPDFKTRLKPAQHLVERFSGTASYEGGAPFKSKAAVAKRTATQLRKAIAELEGNLPEADLAAMKKAAHVLDAQAGDLNVFAQWADLYKKFSTDRRNAADLARAQAFADARWGADTSAHLLEAELLQACDQGNGMQDLARFVIERHPRFADIPAQRFIVMNLRNYTIPGADTRANTAFELMQLYPRSTVEPGFGSTLYAYIGLDIFSAYVEHVRAQRAA